MVDLVDELRELEGINTSFDYGVELVVFAVKECYHDGDILEKIDELEARFEDLFNYDTICRKGFDVGKSHIKNHFALKEKYLNFIKVFKYDSDMYCMISEFKMLLLSKDKGSIWRNAQIEEILDMLNSSGLTASYTVLTNGNTEFEVKEMI